MSFDISKINEWILKVESKVSQAGGEVKQDGKINTAEENSVFTKLVKDKVMAGEITEADANEIFGFIKTNAVEPLAIPTAKTLGNTINTKDGDTIVISIDLNFNINIDITIDINAQEILTDQNALIEKLIGILQAYIEDQNNKDKNLPDIIQAFINQIITQVTAIMNDRDNKFQVDFQDLKDILQQVADKLEDLNCKVDNLTDIILEKMDAMLAYYKNTTVELDKIRDLITNVGVNEEEQIKILNSMMKLLESIKNLQKEDKEEMANLLNSILNKLSSMDTNIKQGFANIIVELVEQGASIQDIQSILEEIEKDTSENNEKSSQILNILTLIKTELGDFSKEVKAGMISIVNQLISQGASMDEIKKLLEGIKQDTSENNKLSLLIFDTIKNLGVEVSASLSEILEAIQTQGGSGTGGDNPVIIALLEEILKQLKQNGDENKAGFKAVLDAISTLGVNVAGQMTEILQAINAQGENSEAIKVILEQILAQAQVNGAENKENFEKVLDAISNLKADNAAAIGDLHTLLDEIKNLLGDNNDKLDNIITNQDTITLILQSFRQEVNDNLTEFGEDGKGILERLDAILQKLDNNQCDCDVDGDALMKMLQDILEAIENHKCECNCNQGGNNEGILSDLSNVLLAPRQNPTGINNTLDNNQNAKNGKFIVNGEVLIFNNGKAYNLRGEEVKLNVGK